MVLELKPSAEPDLAWNCKVSKSAQVVYKSLQAKQGSGSRTNLNASMTFAVSALQQTPPSEVQVFALRESRKLSNTLNTRRVVVKKI